MRKKIVFLPYDFDTAIGINNEGSLVFGYSLEDTDQESGSDVFNGQQSVLWNNLREMYPDEIATMYRQLRSEGKLSYSKVEEMFEAHQDKWPEAIFNEDAKYKYLDPLEDDNDATYLPMLQGSKAEQRKWWLYNRFRYMDSKWNAGDALTDYIQLRGYAKGNITITPYADIYPSIKYGSYLVQTRGVRDQAYTIVCPLDTLNDTEIYIYSASALASIGDISALKVGLADFSRAIKLQEIKIGDSDIEYDNPNLGTLNLGNNTLLQRIDVRNCSGLGDTTKQGHQQTSVDLTGCTGLEEAYFDGTKVLSVDLPNGGVLESLHLPGTITNLTIRNQQLLSEFVCPDYSHITTLWLDNPTSAIDTQAIVSAMANGSRVRLFNFHWEMEGLDDVIEMFNKLDTMTGLDQNGNNTPDAQVYGTIHAITATQLQIQAIQNRYPEVTVTYDVLVPTLIYMNEDGSDILWMEAVPTGQTGTKSLPDNRDSTAQYTYTPYGWSLTAGGEMNPAAINNVQSDRTVYAVYISVVRSYEIVFRRGEDDGNDILKTVNVNYGETPSYGVTTPISVRGVQYAFHGWDPEITTVTGPATYTAVFRAPVTLTYYDYDGTKLHEEQVAYGGNGSWSNTPVRTDTAQFSFTFSGWSRTQGGTVDSTSRLNMTSDRDVYAVYIQTLRNYTITFVRDSSDGGGTLQSRILPYGYMPDYSGDTPTTTKQGEYEFNGWSPPITAVTGNQTYTAVFRDMSDSVVKYLKGAITEYDNSTTAKIADNAFSYYAGLTSVKTAATIIGDSAFYNCTNLITVDFTNPTETISIGPSAFNQCISITAIFIRSSAVATLVNNDSLPIQNFSIGDAAIYVPANLVNAYKVASNWSVYAERIYPISSYPITKFDTIDDDWGTIISKINSGTADYAIGDSKNLDLGSSMGRVKMVIVGIDKDELADNSGNTAKYTWWMKVTPKLSFRMNPLINNNEEGTGTIGGWEHCEFRDYLAENGTFWNLLPSALQANGAIKAVKKYSRIYNTNREVENNVITIDKLFIFSVRELNFNNGSCETLGPIYDGYFNNDADRVAYTSSSGFSSSYALRSADLTDRFYYTGNSGQLSSSSTTSTMFPNIGFCT